VEDALRRTLRTAGLPETRLFETLPPRLYPKCRAEYHEDLERRAGSAKVFTSTNPWRIYDADLLAAAFLGVRFLGVKRNLEDNVLRMYMRRYKRGNVYSYDLNAARDHVAWCHEMIDLLAQRFPKIVRVIRYEDMVANPTAALQAAADLCGLSMPQGALPTLGDDRGCAEPYRQLMGAALNP
jgi:hypothetical protein